MKELLEIQRELRVPKSRTNKFSNYKYRSCEDILEAARPVCNRHGCMLTITDDLEEHGTKLFVRSTAMLFNSDGHCIQTTALAEIPSSQAGMSASQLTGSASSYARKYALCGLFCLDDSKDPDAVAPAVKAERKAVVIDPSIVDEIRKAGTTDELYAIRNSHPELSKVQSMKDLLNNRYNELSQNGDTTKD